VADVAAGRGPTRRPRRPGTGSSGSPGRWTRAAGRCWPPSPRPGARRPPGRGRGRVPGRPGRGPAELSAWDHPALAEAQAATAAALDAAERRARDLPAAAEGLEFEHRNERVADVLDELLPVQAAEQAVRALRRRGQPARAGGRQTRQGR
jgi:hypothetical protein